MARRPLSGDIAKITEELGKTYEGTYAGSRLVDSGNKNDQGETQLSTVHTLETENGPFSFWGFTAINNVLAPVKPGTYLWITYRGRVRSKRGGTAHTVAVDYDDEPMSHSAPESEADTTPSTAPAFDPDKVPF